MLKKTWRKIVKKIKIKPGKTNKKNRPWTKPSKIEKTVKNIEKTKIKNFEKPIKNKTFKKIQVQ